jgi:molecular chaperone GrpE (heat shock protein)
VQKNRNAAYDKILKDLNTLVVKLDNQAFETTALKENIAVLQGKVDSYKTNMNNYQLAVTDMATVDCAADPLAFISALQAARKAHEAVLPQITDIRAYVTNTIKPSLQQIRVQIGSGQTTGGTQ